jgi:hypothetical protein
LKKLYTDDETTEDEEEITQPIYHEIMASELVDENMNSLKPEAQMSPANFYNQESKSKEWKHCNTLAWSRNKEHLQRVQLNMIDMKSCENVSITTVNSLCAESVYHKQDCNVSLSKYSLL